MLPHSNLGRREAATQAALQPCKSALAPIARAPVWRQALASVEGLASICAASAVDKWPVLRPSPTCYGLADSLPPF
eukprot:4678925-Alexandrium_andersonii.AAC.1